MNRQQKVSTNEDIKGVNKILINIISGLEMINRPLDKDKNE